MFTFNKTVQAECEYIFHQMKDRVSKISSILRFFLKWEFGKQIIEDLLVRETTVQDEWRLK